MACQAQGAASSGSSGDGAPPRWQLWPPLASLLRALRGAITSALGLGLLAALVPSLLSTQPGTRVVEAAVSRMCPGEGHVRLKTLQLGRLLHLPEVRTAEAPLLALLAGRPLTVTISRPVVDASLHESGEELRLPRFLDGVSALGLVLPGRQRAAAAAAAGAPDAPARPAAASSGAGGDVQRPAALPEEAGDQGQAPRAGSAGSLGLVRRLRSAVKGRHLGAATDDSGAVSEAASAAAGSTGAEAVRQRLTQVDSSVEFTGELRAGGLHVYLADGQLLVSEEVREAVGTHVHVLLALGAPQVTDVYAEIGSDGSSPASTSPSNGHGASGSAAHDAPGADAAAAARHDPAAWMAEAAGVQAPGTTEAGEMGGPGREPVLLLVSSERVDGEARGWRLRGGRYRLQRPAGVSVDFTPALARLVLAQLNPLLQNCVELRQQSRVTATYAPADMAWPNAQGRLQVAPLKLVLGQGPLVDELLALARLKGSAGPQWLDRLRRLEAWTGPLVVDLRGRGRFEAQRADVLLGPSGSGGGGGWQVAVWGAMDAPQDRIAMRLGLPCATLAQLGIRGLPPSYVLPLELSGRLSSPHIDVTAAVKKLAALSMMQALTPQQQHQQLLSGGGGDVGLAAQGAGQRLWGGLMRSAATATGSFIEQMDSRVQAELQDVPAPAKGLPWQQGR